MATMTITQASVKVLRYEPPLEALQVFCKDAEKETDKLSSDVHDLMEEGLEKIRPLRDPQEIEAVAKKYYTQARQLLLNPFALKEAFIPLVHPVIERGQTYELATHADCRRVLNGKSPFDGLPMEENPQPHPTASKVIVWLNKQEGIEGDYPSQALVEAGDNPAKRAEFYKTRAQILLRLEAIWERGQAAKLRTKERQQQLVLRQNQGELLLSKVQTRARTATEVLRNQMVALQRSTETRVADVKAAQAVERQLFEGTVAAQKEQLVQMEGAHTADLQKLQGEMEKTKLQNQEAQAAVTAQAQAAVVSAGQAIAIQQASLQQAEAARAQQSALHRADLSRAQQATQEQARQLSSVQQSLYKTEGKLSAQEEAYRKEHERADNLQCQIDNFQPVIVYEDSGPSCVVQ